MCGFFLAPVEGCSFRMQRWGPLGPVLCFMVNKISSEKKISGGKKMSGKKLFIAEKLFLAVGSYSWQLTVGGWQVAVDRWQLAGGSQ